LCCLIPASIKCKVTVDETTGERTTTYWIDINLLMASKRAKLFHFAFTRVRSRWDISKQMYDILCRLCALLGLTMDSDEFIFANPHHFFKTGERCIPSADIVRQRLRQCVNSFYCWDRMQLWLVPENKVFDYTEHAQWAKDSKDSVWKGQCMVHNRQVRTFHLFCCWSGCLFSLTD